MDPKRKSRATLVEFLAQMVAAVEYIHKTSSLSFSLSLSCRHRFFFFFSFFAVSLVRRNQPNDIRPKTRSVAFNRFLLLLPMYLRTIQREKLHS